MKVLKYSIIILQLVITSCSEPVYDLGIFCGTLIDGTGDEPLKNKLIIIQDGKILNIVDNSEQNNFNFKRTIAASDKYLIPGLFDMHSHVTMTNRVQDTLNGRIQARVNYDRETAKWALETLLRYGVVTVRETGGFIEAARDLKIGLENNQITGPDLFICGPLIESGTPHFSNMSSIVNTEEEAIQEVSNQVDAGVDFIKFYGTLPPELSKIVIAEGHKRNKRVLGHLGETTWFEAIEFGIDGIVHTPDNSIIENEDSLRILTQAMVEQQIANDPTLYISKTILQQVNIPSELQDLLPLKLKKSWDQESEVFRTKIIPHINMEELFRNKIQYVNTAYESGVTILAGSDFNNSNTFPGYSLHMELQELSRCRISNDSLIKMATFDAAEWLGISEYQGTIEQGKRADIIILNKNPLDDISNTLEIDKVVFKGKLVTEE